MARKEAPRQKGFEEVEKFLRKQKLLEGAWHEVERIETGIPGLDHALGGGFPRGRFTEVFGFEGSGKTTLALTLGAAIQRHDSRRLLLWDFEHAVSRDYAESIGVNLERKRFKWEQPSCLENGVDSLIELVKTGEVAVAVVDSLSTMLPLAELKGKVKDNNYALQARKISQFLRKITPLLGKHQTDLICVSHLKEKIGTPFYQTSSVGGRAPKFYATLRIEMKARMGADFTKRGGMYTLAKIIKNKTTANARIVVPLPIGSKGVIIEVHIRDCLLSYGALQSKGSWFYLGGKKVAQGEARLLRDITKRPDKYLEELKRVWADGGHSSDDGWAVIGSGSEEDEEADVSLTGEG